MRDLRSLRLLAFAFAALSVSLPTQAQTTGIVSLAQLRDRARPLLIFAAKPDDPQLEIQLRRIHQDAPALAERQVVAIALPYQSPSTTPAQLSDSGTQAARRRFNVAPSDFTVILLGKDGEEKFRSSAPVSIDKICDLIDAMPMRQEEMRSRSASHP